MLQLGEELCRRYPNAFGSYQSSSAPRSKTEGKHVNKIVRMFTGDEPMKVRTAIVDAVNSHQSPIRVVLATVRTGAVGVNMVCMVFPLYSTTIL